MKRSSKSATGDLIVEPIQEAVAVYDNLLDELHRFMILGGRDWYSLKTCTDTVLQETRKFESEKRHAVELTMFTVDNSLQVSSTANQMTEPHSLCFNQNILQGPEYRYFATLVKRPGPDSIRAFNHIISKVIQQSVNTINAMLPHIIYKITNTPETPSTNPDKMINANPAELFDLIQRRLKLGNDVHMTFKRVGKTTLDNFQRLKEQNEIWMKIWEDGLMQLEPKTVRISFDQVKNAMMNLERTMAACLRAIHTHQMKKGW
ncbi:hypothetical protein E4T50_14719 [Aureobasidium sp. EXF-12298]|nr:hypothetical protein E4T50_14719 [Aureobasidium sp. EXF-12298]